MIMMMMVVVVEVALVAVMNDTKNLKTTFYLHYYKVVIQTGTLNKNNQFRSMKQVWNQEFQRA